MFNVYRDTSSVDIHQMHRNNKYTPTFGVFTDILSNSLGASKATIISCGLWSTTIIAFSYVSENFTKYTINLIKFTIVSHNLYEHAPKCLLAGLPNKRTANLLLCSVACNCFFFFANVSLYLLDLTTLTLTAHFRNQFFTSKVHHSSLLE